MNLRLQKLYEKIGFFYTPLVILLLSIVILVMGYTNVQPKQYSFNLNQVAEETIQSPITIEDVEQTELNRERARNNVADAYIFQPDIADQQIAILEQYFSQINELRGQQYSTEQIIDMVETSNLPPSYIEEIESEDRSQTQDVLFGQLNDAEKMIVYLAEFSTAEPALEELATEIPDETIDHILAENEEGLTELRNATADMLGVILSVEIEASQLNRVFEEVNRRIMSLNLPNDLAIAMRDISLELVVPTVVYSESETLKRQEEAAAAVLPSFILQGQIIVQEGHIINETAIRQLDILGLLNQQSSNNTAIVFILLIIVHAFLLYYFNAYFNKDNPGEARNNITAYAILFAIGFTVMKLIQLAQTNGINYAMLLFPIYVMPLLLVPRTNKQSGLFFILFYNLFAWFIIHDGSSMTMTLIISIFYLFSSLISYSHFIFKVNTKQIGSLYRYGLGWHALFAVPIVSIIHITVFGDTSLMIFAFIFFNVFSSLLLYFLIEPYWNKLLSSRAPLSLNQLSNMNHPLLKLLIEVAPGTYHHSMLVANLSANASESIGADSLFARVAAYYHDVGKTFHPLFFVENLSDGMESPHTMVEPEESAQIIIGHVSEGAKLLEEHNLPQSIIDICWQHHGTTLVRYFYHQAKKQADHKVEESLFRYHGPIPQTKEAMIIMLADSIEAASRTLKDYSQTDIEQLIDSIISSKVAEGQFADAPLTVNELLTVRKSFIKSVASMYHTRIEYPD